MASLERLPVEILFDIFKYMNRPSRLALGLTTPSFLHLLAKYFDLDRIRRKWNIGLPENIAWSESAAQPAIVRCLSIGVEEPEIIRDDEVEEGLEGHFECKPYGPYAVEDEVPSYEESDEAREDDEVERIINSWLRDKFNISVPCILCGECYRYILTERPSRNPFRPRGTMEITPWARIMLRRPR
jgi:hypothetical protein